MKRQMLQWGRRNYPAETRGTNATPPVRYSALQWGRRNYPAETSQADGRMALQWGRRNYPAETDAPSLVSARSAVCFNGAAGITRRKPTRHATSAV